MELYDDCYQEHDIGAKRSLPERDVEQMRLLLRGTRLGPLIDVGARNGSVLNELLKRHLVDEAAAVEISASGL